MLSLQASSKRQAAAGMAQQLQCRRATLHDAQTLQEFVSSMAMESENIHLDPAIVRRGVEGPLRDASRGIYFIGEAGM